MSWDVLVYAAKAPPPPLAEMPDDWRGDSLGTLEEVRRKISTSLPAVDWSDPSWGLYDGAGFSFEFNIGDEEPSHDFMVHVRGGGEAVPLLVQLAQNWGWYLLDCSRSEWLHHCTDVEAGWQRFQAYRDRVLGLTEPQG